MRCSVSIFISLIIFFFAIVFVIEFFFVVVVAPNMSAEFFRSGRLVLRFEARDDVSFVLISAERIETAFDAVGTGGFLASDEMTR